jgi:outer membrane protein
MRITLLNLITVLMISLAVSSGANAQDTWSLERCIQHALDNNIQIKQQELSTQYNSNNLLQSKLSLLPTVSATGSYGASFGRALDQTTYEYTNNQTVQSLNLSANGNLTLFSGLQKVNTIRQNRYDMLASLQDLEKLKNDVSLNVAASYLQILFNQELLQVAKNQLEVTNLQVDRTSKLVEAGSLPMGSLLEIQSQQASEELQVTNALNSLDLSFLTLSQLLELDSVGNLSIEQPNLSTFAEEAIDANIQQAYALAEQNLPQIKSAEYKLKSSEVGLAIARGAMSPRLFMGLSYGTGYSDIRKKTQPGPYTPPLPIGTAGGDTVFSFPQPTWLYNNYAFNAQLQDNASTTISLGVQIPLFTGWATRNQISNAKINARNYKYSLESSKNILYKDIQQAYQDAVAALKKFRSTEKALSAMRESFKYTQQKFEVGLVNTVDYFTSKSQLTRTESELLQAKYDYIFRIKILDFYMGKPLTL